MRDDMISGLDALEIMYGTGEEKKQPIFEEVLYRYNNKLYKCVMELVPEPGVVKGL